MKLYGHTANPAEQSRRAGIVAPAPLLPCCGPAAPMLMNYSGEKHPKMAPKTEKHAIFDAKMPIFWTQTPRPDKMKELNKALEAIGGKPPQPHR